MPDDVRYVSHSELATWKRCHRRWYLAYYEGLRPAGGEERTGIRRIGTRIHAALAAHYAPDLPYAWRASAGFKKLREMQEEDELVLATQLDPEGMLVMDEERLKKITGEFQLEQRMLEGYEEWLEETGADEDLEPVAAEERVTIPLGLGGRTVNLSGTLDLRVRRVSSGIILLFDHKTVQSLHIKELHMNTQLKHYTMLDRLRGSATSGALFNMLRKVKRTSTAKPPFYGREEVRFNPEELRAYWYAVDGALREIFNAEEKLDRGWDHHVVTYPTVTDSCSWQCDYFTLCPMLDDGSRWRDLVQTTHVRVDARHTYRDSVPDPDQGDPD